MIVRFSWNWFLFCQTEKKRNMDIKIRCPLFDSLGRLVLPKSVTAPDRWRRRSSLTLPSDMKVSFRLNQFALIESGYSLQNTSTSRS